MFLLRDLAYDFEPHEADEELAEHVLERAGFDVVEVEHRRRVYGRYLCTLRA